MTFRCAVIEDDFDQNDVIKRIAEHAGFATKGYLNAESFLAESDYNYACFLVDWGLPGISGLELVPIIRSKNPLAKIIFITSLQGSDDIHRGLDAGADDYIWKPYDSESLRLKLLNCLKKYQAIAEGNLNLGVQFVDEVDLLIVEGQKFFFTQTEYNIVKTLFEKKGEVVSREDLTSRFDISLDSVDVYMHAIRRKMMGSEVQIKCKRGMGYLWVK